MPFGRGSSGNAGDSGPRRRIEAARASGFRERQGRGQGRPGGHGSRRAGAFAQRAAAGAQAWVAEEAEKLAQRLAAGLGELEARIADATARVLEPFLQAELRRQAIADLRAELEALLAKEPGRQPQHVRARGPAAGLARPACRQLAGKTVSVDYRPSEEPDVRIIGRADVLETRLGAWAAKIEEALR